MKILILVPLLLAASSSFANPTAVEVVTAILRDSGMGDSRNIEEIQYSSQSRGADRKSSHSLSFTHHSRKYECSLFNLNSTPLKTGEYFVFAELSECKNANGKTLVLKNNYTNSFGRTAFRRVFYNQNKKFRFLNNHDRQIVSRKDPFLLDDSSREKTVKVLHTNDLEDGVFVIDTAGGISPIN